MSESLTGMSRPIQSDQPVYRGTEMLLEELVRLEAGESLPLNAFTSTSRSPEKALVFIPGSATSGHTLVFMEMGVRSARGIVYGGAMEQETILSVGQQVRRTGPFRRVMYNERLVVMVPVVVEQEEVLVQKTSYSVPDSGWAGIRLPLTATDQERRDAAVRYYYLTGDPGPAQDMGVSLPDQRNVWKAAPGAPPRPGLEWREETSRWIRPKKRGGGVDFLSRPYRQVHSEAERQYESSPDRQRARNLPSVRRYYNYEYAELNYGLREGLALEDEDRETFEGMKRAMRPTQREYEVFRGWRNNPEAARVEVGQVLASPQFMSTTFSSHYAVRWMGYNSSTERAVRGNPLWRIRVPEGTSALILQGASNDYETELTLDTGLRFRCVAVHQGEVKVRVEGRSLYVQDVYEMEVVRE